MVDRLRELPTARSSPVGFDVAKLRAFIWEQGLVGVSNNTKWDELINLVRARRDQEGWAPSYRSKWVSGQVSGWDCEWDCHLPFPFLGVRWFDISTLGTGGVDESRWLLPAVAQIGFDHELAGDVIRIWGYLPRCYEDFPPSSA